MAAPIESQILVRIKALIEGAPQLQSFLGGLRGLRNGTGGLNSVSSSAKSTTSALSGLHNIGRQVALTFYSLGRAGHYLSTIIFSLSGGLTVFLASLITVAAAAAGGLFAYLIKEGVAFNAEIEQLRLGFASLVFSFADVKNAQGELVEGQEKWNSSVELSNALMEQLYIKTFQTNRTVNELAAAFQSGLAPALNAGLNLQQSLDIITRIVQAADVFKLKANEINEEVRNLLAGNATRDTRIAVALFGSATAANAAVQQAKEQGNLLDLLTTKLEGFRRAGEKLPKTFEGAMSNLRDLFKRVAGEISLNFKEELTKGLINVFDRIVDTEKLKQGVFQLRPEFQKVYDITKKLADELASRIPQALDYIFTKVKDIFNYIDAKSNDGTLSQLSTLLGEIADIIGIIFRQGVELYGENDTGLRKILYLITLIVHTINVLLQAVNVFVAFTKTVIFGVILGALNLVLSILARIIEAIIGKNSVSNAMFQWAKDAESYLTSILDNLVEQYKFLLKLIGAYDDLRARRNSTGTDEPTGYARVTLNPDGTVKQAQGANLANTFGTKGTLARQDGAKDSARKRRGEVSALKELNRALIAEAISKARIEFDVVRDSLKRQLDVYKQHYEDLRLGINAFYALKDEKQRASAEAEIKYLNALKDESYIRYTEQLVEISESEDTEKAKARRRQAALIQHQTRERELNAEIKKAEQDLNNDISDNARERELAWKALSRTVNDVYADITEAGDRTAEAAAIRIDEQFRDILDQLRVNFTENGSVIKMVEKYIEFLKQQAQLQEVLTRYDREQRKAALEQAEIQDLFNRGKLTQIEYEREINRLNDEAFQQQEDLLAQAYLLAQTEEERLGIREALQRLKETRREINSFAEDINGTLRGSISAFSDSVVDDFQNIGANFRKMSLGILQDITKMVLRAVVLQGLFARLGILEGSTEGIGGTLSRIFGTSTSPRKFAHGTPFVTGPGTETSDSVPAMLSVGEAVIPAKAVRRVGYNVIKSIISGNYLKLAGGGIVSSAPSGGTGTPNNSLPPKVVVALDNQTIANEMMSSAGEKVWLHHFNKNKRALGLA